MTDVTNFFDDLLGKSDEESPLDDKPRKVVPILVCRTRTARAFVTRTASPHEIGISIFRDLLLLLSSSFPRSGGEGGGGGDMEERHEAR